LSLRALPTGLQAAAHRTDRGDLLRAVRTDEGYMLAEGYMARPGVMRYSDGDSEWFELVPEETLHDAESLATIAAKPLTVEHPAENVGPDNVAQLGAGDVGDEVTVADNGFVRVKFAARRRDALDAIEGGKVQLSPGYVCDVDWQPGEHPKYGRYDAIQRNRRYNHLALVDRARGGPEMRVRVDGAAWQVDAPTEPDAPAQENPMNPMEALIAALIAVGHTEEAAKAAAEKLAAAAKGEEPKPEVEVEVEDAKPEGEAPDYKAMYEDALAKMEAMKADMGKMVKADSIPAMVADLAAVRAVAAGWGVEPGEQPADKLRAAVVEKAKPGALRKDASSAEVRAAFAMLPASPASASPWAAVTASRTDSAEVREDSGGFTMKIGARANKES
jgi:uncharacterized protein